MYFEDYEVGQVFDNIESAIFTKEEIINAGKNWDKRDIHIYEDNPYFDGVISPGSYSIMKCWGKWVDTGIDAKGIIAGVGIKSGAWLKPIFPDVEYKIKVEIVEKKVKTQGRNGLIAYKMTVTNPKGEVVLEYTPYGLVKFRNSK